jgi:hypothetical protein
MPTSSSFNVRWILAASAILSGFSVANPIVWESAQRSLSTGATDNTLADWNVEGQVDGTLPSPVHPTPQVVVARQESSFQPNGVRMALSASQQAPGGTTLWVGGTSSFTATFSIADSVAVIFTGSCWGGWSGSFGSGTSNRMFALSLTSVDDSKLWLDCAALASGPQFLQLPPGRYTLTAKATTDPVPSLAGGGATVNLNMQASGPPARLRWLSAVKPRVQSLPFPSSLSLVDAWGNQYQGPSRPVAVAVLGAEGSVTAASPGTATLRGVWKGEIAVPAAHASCRLRATVDGMVAESEAFLVIPYIIGGDFDADGADDLLEAAMNLDPTKAEALALDPQSLDYPRPKDSRAWVFTVKVSPDLHNWTTLKGVGESVTESPDDPLMERVRIGWPQAVMQWPHRFTLVKVSRRTSP